VMDSFILLLLRPSQGEKMVFPNDDVTDCPVMHDVHHSIFFEVERKRCRLVQDVTPIER
jgi:hypothetical protein